jgi:ferredoxin-NADP reductase
MTINKQANIWVKCNDIIRETADVKTFIFTPFEGNINHFKAGQFITLHCQINGIDYARCYTISSSPTVDNSIEIIVKAVVDGKVSNWLLDHLRIGDELKMIPASGNFFLSSDNRKKLLLLSAGSGITPMLSIVKHIANQQLDYDIIFHHSARSEMDLIQPSVLDICTKHLDKFSLSYNFTRFSSSPHSSAKHFDGRFDANILNDICDDLAQRDVFICGPVDFMSSTKTLLLQAGLPSDQYFEESFELTEAVEDDSLASKTYQIEFSYSAQSLTLKGNQTVLHAVQEAGIELDISCTSGACGSCNSYLIKGEIHAPEAQAITSKDSARGEFLPCCSFARSDLVVDL